MNPKLRLLHVKVIEGISNLVDEHISKDELLRTLDELYEFQERRVSFRNEIIEEMIEERLDRVDAI